MCLNFFVCCFSMIQVLMRLRYNVFSLFYPCKSVKCVNFAHGVRLCTSGWLRKKKSVTEGVIGYGLPEFFINSLGNALEVNLGSLRETVSLVYSQISLFGKKSSHLFLPSFFARYMAISALRIRRSGSLPWLGEIAMPILILTSMSLFSW